MSKRMFRKLYSPALSDRLAKYAQPDQETLLRSEHKLQNAVQDGSQYEDEVHGVTEYKGHRFAPVVSLAACAVLVAGIGGIYALQANSPADLNPGSVTEQLAASRNVAPFGDIAGLELQFSESSNIVFEELPQDMVFTISAEQQAALAEALNVFSWERTNDSAPPDSYVLSMYFNTEEGENIVQFWLEDNIVEWWHNDTDLKGIPRHVGILYQIDDALSNCVRDIVLNNILTRYPEEFVAVEDMRYMHHMYSSHTTFDHFDLKELDVLFMTEDSVPEYYTIPPQQKQQLAEYIANREAWEILPDDREDGIMPEGEHFCMYYSTLEYESVVAFWSEGYITEQVKGDSIIKWWQTKPEMYNSLKMLIEKRQDSFELPYQYFEEAEENPDKVLDAMFGEKGAPFGDITNESIRGTCAAYAPYVAEPDKDAQQALAEAMNNAVWRELDRNGDYQSDGESYILVVWNNGKPYSLIFYPDQLVYWSDVEDKEQWAYYRTSADLSGLVYDALNYEGVLDHLTWVEVDEQRGMAACVWDAVNAEAAEADLSAYEAVMDEFNHKHRVHWAIITPENTANGGPSYADAIAEILAMTPEEYADYLEEAFAQSPLPYPAMPELTGEVTVSYRAADGTEKECSTREDFAELVELINCTYWTNSTQKEGIIVTSKMPTDEELAAMPEDVRANFVFDPADRDAGRGYVNAFVFRNENKTLTICPDEHIAVWFVAISDENKLDYSNAYYDLFDELEALLNSIER